MENTTERNFIVLLSHSFNENGIEIGGRGSQDSSAQALNKTNDTKKQSVISLT